jgi:hypothetical protein
MIATTDSEQQQRRSASQALGCRNASALCRPAQLPPLGWPVAASLRGLSDCELIRSGGHGRGRGAEL